MKKLDKYYFFKKEKKEEYLDGRSITWVSKFLNFETGGKNYLNSILNEHLGIGIYSAKRILEYPIANGKNKPIDYYFYLDDVKKK